MWWYIDPHTSPLVMTSKWWYNSSLVMTSMSRNWFFCDHLISSCWWVTWQIWLITYPRNTLLMYIFRLKEVLLNNIDLLVEDQIMMRMYDLYKELEEYLSDQELSAVKHVSCRDDFLPLFCKYKIFQFCLWSLQFFILLLISSDFVNFCFKEFLK